MSTWLWLFGRVFRNPVHSVGWLSALVTRVARLCKVTSSYSVLRKVSFQWVSFTHASQIRSPEACSPLRS